MKEHDEFKQTYGLDTEEYDRRYPSQKKKDLDKVDYLRKKLEKEKALSHKEKHELSKLVRLLPIELSAGEAKYIKVKKSKPSRRGRYADILATLVAITLLVIGAWEVRAYVHKRGVETTPTAVTEMPPPVKEPGTETSAKPQEGAKTTPNSGAPATPQTPNVASVCSDTPIPFSTVIKYDSTMYVGETQAYGGQNGYTTTCTRNSAGYKPADYTLQPYNRTLYIGTKVPPQPPVDTSETREERIARCLRNLRRVPGVSESTLQICYTISF